MNSLIEKVVDGDLEGVREVLRSQPQLLSVSEEDATPLFWACELGYPEIALVLIEAGADPNQASGDGETPLHTAAFEGDEECTRILLQHKADANAGTTEGQKPLMNAAKGGSLKSLKILLSHGANAKAKDAVGRTALHWAMTSDHDQASIATALLAAGVDARWKNNNGDTALDYAHAMKKSALAAALVAHIGKGHS